MLDESTEFRSQLRTRAFDDVRDSLLSTEILASLLRSNHFHVNEETDDTLRIPPSAREITRRANYAKRRRRLGEHWRENGLKRIYLLLRGRRGSTKEQQRFVSLCAWTFAIAGMFVCIGFLLADFFDSRDNPALIARTVEAEHLQFPVVTFCSLISGIPLIDSFNTKNYTGRPLFASRAYRDPTLNKTLWFPESHTSGRVTSFILGPAQCKNEMKTLSFRSIKPNPRFLMKACLPCYQIGVNPGFKLTNSRILDSVGRVVVEFALSRELAFCLLPEFSSIELLRREILNEIKKNAKKLMQLGVLSLSGTSDVQFALNNAFDTMRRRSRGGDLTEYNQAFGSFVCNVYFASGFFYPKPSNVEIKYRYDINSDIWEETGVGPYHKLSPQKSFKSVSDFGIKLDSARSLLVYLRDRSRGLRPNSNDKIGFLRVLKTSSIQISKVMDDNVPKYHIRKPLSAQLFSLVRGRYSIFESNFDFEHFRVEIKSRQPSISVSELVNDIFQYGALFTGVCVYSILVGPAKWYLRRSAAVREARDVANVT